jgi:hypothetical protein
MESIMTTKSRKQYGELKLEVGKSDSLSLYGAPANEAVTCMRNAGVMPSQPTLGGNPEARIEVDKAGNVHIDEYGLNANGKDDQVATNMKVAHDQNPAEASTPTVGVSGTVADEMRQKARACAFNSIHLKP